MASDLWRKKRNKSYVLVLKNQNVHGKQLVNDSGSAHLPFYHAVRHLASWCILHPADHGDVDIRHLRCHEGLVEV